MKILITGGAGFIGSHLAEFYLKNGHYITVIDNFITGSEENIENFLSHPRFSFIKADVSEFNFSKLREKYDVVFHLASPASPIKYMQHPLETIKANVYATERILKAAMEGKFRRVVYASTSEVYGDPLEHPQKESYWGNVNPRGPRACYDESKRLGETLCYVYFSKYNVDVRTARIFNTYGPRMDLEDGRVVSTFVVRALKGEDLPVHGKGKQTRSFCYVDDMVRGLDKLAVIENLAGEVFNLGNPEEKTILELAHIIIRLTGSSSKISFIDRPIDDPERRQPDIAKAKKVLGWKPEVPLEEGLRRTIEFFKSRLL